MRLYTKAKGMPVGTIGEGVIVGKLDDLQFDLGNHRIYGYRIKSGWFGGATGVAAGELVKLGKDLALLRSETSVDAGGVPRTEEPGRAWASDYVGRKVMSRRGQQVGEVGDLLLDEGLPAVRALLLEDGRFVNLDARVTLGRDVAILEDDEQAVKLGEAKVETSEWWVAVGARLGV